MGCKPKKIKCQQSNTKKRGIKVTGEKMNLKNLEEMGRIQFFFHSQSSKLPIRDILNEQKRGHKTEPHIEIGAENYICCCYQKNNIVPFLESREKYLFLFTTCKNKELGGYYDKRFIVGYITKQTFIGCYSHYAVRGETRLFSFEDAYPLECLVSNPKEIRRRKLSPAETKKILNHFQERKNILYNCVREIKKLDENNKKKYKTCKILRGESCRFQKNGCLRWSMT